MVIVLAAAVLGAAECSARFLFPRISHIQRRIMQDRREAFAIGNPGAGEPPVVLLVGNSLLLHGMDYPAIQNKLAPEARVVRFAIEQTDYLDWYYGLRHLFASGAKPSVVVLCLNLGQTLDPMMLGEYSSRHLFGTRDLLPAARAAHLDTTQTSGLIFAHWSAFYADRVTIRNYILNVTAPGYTTALRDLAQTAPAFPSTPEVIARSRARLRAFRELCRQNGSDFILLVPPALAGEDELLAQAGALENVTVDIPVPRGGLGPEFFRDGFHLNTKGASIFTEALARDIRARLNRQNLARSELRR